MGLGATMLPEVLWSQAQQEGAPRITQAMLQNALALSGLTFPDEDQKAMLQAINQNLTRYEELRARSIFRTMWRRRSTSVRWCRA
jgi:hypothetical protein